MKLPINLADLRSRALHTFWQTFTGLLGAWWLASGLDAVHQVTDVASAKRVALGALAAVAAAALSAGRVTVASILTARAGDFAALVVSQHSALDEALATLAAAQAQLTVNQTVIAPADAPPVA